MRTSFTHVTNRTIRRLVAFLLLVWPHTASAITYMSIETVPNEDVAGVGEDVVITIRSIGYANLERWSQRLLVECCVVDSVIGALTADEAIDSVTSTNTRFVVAAGGFEGGTNPSFVFTVKDSGAGSVTEADVNVLGNALGYVLSQGSTAHFSPDNFKAYAFPLDYILVTFSGTLSGDEAQAFFEHLGKIDEALFSGLFAGFTQVNLPGSLKNNSMLFLQPAVSKRRFISGLSAAVEVYRARRIHRSRTTARRRRRERASRFPKTIGSHFERGNSIWQTSADPPSYGATLRSSGCDIWTPSPAWWRQLRKMPSRSTSPRSSRARIECDVGESGGAIRFEWRRHLMHSYSTTVTLSGAQPPWKPNGTRTGRRIVAIGSPAKSWASRMTTSLRSRFGS